MSALEKPLQYYMDNLPAGAFEKMVREKLDPRYGLSDEPGVLFKVKMRYYFSGSTTHNMEVYAINKADAEKRAREQFNDEILDFDCSNAEVDDVEIDEIMSMELPDRRQESAI